MNQSQLQSLIQQALQLSPGEKELLIKAVITDRNDRPLNEKEKQFIEKSKEYISELQIIGAQLDKVFNKFE